MLDRKKKKKKKKTVRNATTKHKVRYANTPINVFPPRGKAGIPRGLDQQKSLPPGN